VHSRQPGLGALAGARPGDGAAGAHSPGPDLLNGAALLDTALSILFGVTLLASAVLLTTWLYRARKNLEAFPGAEVTMGAGWAVGGWFVPPRPARGRPYGAGRRRLAPPTEAELAGTP